MTNELNILKWIAGGPEPVIDSQKPVNDKLMLDLIRVQRLAPRFREFTRDRPLPWCQKNLTLGVWKQSRSAQNSLQRQIATTAEVAAALSETGTPLITVKGFVTYAITGDARNVRYSGDIDVMFPDMERLHGALTRIGFSGEPCKRAAHEYSEMTRGNQRIEPHRHFPVFSYPKPRPPDLIPTRNPGQWVQNTRNRVEWKIGYDDLLQHCQQGVTAETYSLTVPNPAMVALILCAHEFREFIQRPCRNAVIRLSTLADIRDLVQQESFHRNEFLFLVHQFTGEDSVQLVRYLHQSYFGFDPLPFFETVAPIPNRYAFPQSLTYYGGWADLGEKPDDFLLPATTQDVFRHLQPNAIIAGADEASPTYDGLTNGSGLRLDRTIIQTAQETLQPAEAGMPFALSATWSAEALSVEVVLRTPLEKGRNYQMKLYSSDGINSYHNVNLRLPEDSQDEMSEVSELEQTHRESAVGFLKKGHCHIRFTLP